MENPKQRSTKEIWLNAALKILCDSGVEAVKVMPLAKALSMTRTSFYWHFKDRDALLEAMINCWEKKNTGNLVRQANAYADNVAEAIFNIFDCWVDAELFDSQLDLAIRNWARNDAALQKRLDLADKTRLDSLTAMLMRFDFPQEQAQIRAMTMIYTQIGYFSMGIAETLEERVKNMPTYIKVFTGASATKADIRRFCSRHGVDA